MKFSLRSLFVLTTVLAGLTGLCVRHPPVAGILLAYLLAILGYVCFAAAYSGFLLACFYLFHACRRGIAFLMSKTRTP